MPKRIKKHRDSRRRIENARRINNKISNEQWEDLSKRERVNSRFDSVDYPDKSRNYNSISYARRWLQKQIGRHWNDIYSEICRDIPICERWTFTCNVTVKTIMIDGKIYDRDLWSRVGSYVWGSKCEDEYYVHPETGILESIRPEAPQEELDPNKRTIEGKCYECINGTWFQLEIESFDKYRYFKGYDQYVREFVRKRTLSKKEIKKLGLMYKKS